MKTFNIQLPISGEEMKKIGAVVQNDANANQFVLSLMDGSVPFDLTLATNVTFTVLKPDGSKVIDSLGSRISITNMGQGEVKILLLPSVINLAGECIASLEIYSGTARMTTARMYYVVIADISQGTDAEVLAKNEYPVLQNLINDVSNLENSVESAEAIRVSNEATRVMCETTRENNEFNRSNAETERVKKDIDRGKSEDSRNSAEASRATAESARVAEESKRSLSEGNRGAAETDRNSAETTRISSEVARNTAESNREKNEVSRISSEAIRNTEETSRTQGEIARGKSEDSRNSAEASRATAESARSNSEILRSSTETSRATAENQRQSDNAAMKVWEQYNPDKSYVPLNKVTYLGSSYINVAACARKIPTDMNHWLPIAMKGADGQGSGDMLKSAYDINNSGVVDDAEKFGGQLPNYYTKVATITANGLMASVDKVKLNGISENANDYKHPLYKEMTNGLYKVTIDSTGHILDAYAVTKTDITSLGIPAQDTIYIHPVNHPANMITPDTTHRFVSDTEKTAWGGKAVAVSYAGVIGTAWVGAAAPYTQIITVNGLLTTDKQVHIKPIYSTILSAKIAEKEAWNMISDADVTAANQITFTCFEDKPVTAISIQLEVIR